MFVSPNNFRKRQPELITLELSKEPILQRQTTFVGEIILGTFSSQMSFGSLPSYHVFVTDKRVMGIKTDPKIKTPMTAEELDSPNVVIDFSILRDAIVKVAMRKIDKTRIMFLLQFRGRRTLKILIRYSSDIELQKAKELFLEGFSRSKEKQVRGSPQWRKKISDSLQASWDFRSRARSKR